ncbi:MAG TPA: septation protein A [Gammaproteobacteria bacterium]|nr:septation protein A [Gammaproteobacteria bacterium]
MAALFEFLPIVLFFVVFKIYGIYVATGALIVTSVIQLGVSWWRERKIKTMPLVVTILAIVLGGITIALHDPAFIKWKFSVVYWLFGAVFIASGFIGKKTLVERAMGSQISLPGSVWGRLNLSWALFFLLLGGVNAWVIYNLTTEQWVDFKFYGVLGATLLFVIGQGIYLSRHIDMDPEKEG